MILYFISHYHDIFQFHLISLLSFWMIVIKLYLCLLFRELIESNKSSLDGMRKNLKDMKHDKQMLETKVRSCWFFERKEWIELMRERRIGENWLDRLDWELIRLKLIEIDKISVSEIYNIFIIITNKYNIDWEKEIRCRKIRNTIKKLTIHPTCLHGWIWKIRGRIEVFCFYRWLIVCW